MYVPCAPAPRPIRTRRRERCAGCGLTEALCLCASLLPNAVRTRVIVIAHRNEVHKTTNTGKLAVRMLEGAALRVRGDGREVAPSVEERAARRLVLYPAPDARVIEHGDLRSGEPLVLVVPDGSWPQARKIARRDPLAEGAEHVTLPPGAPSRYGLRRNPREGGLCTLEAIARAMGVLEGAAIEAELLRILELFVSRQRDVRVSRV